MNQSNPERTGRAMTMREIREALGHNVNPQPPVDRAAWVDGDPLLEAIARAVWEQCEHHDSGLIIDDPRNIAVAALAAVLTEPTDRAAVLLEAAEVAESFDIDASPQTVAAELHRMAVEAHGTGTQQTTGEDVVEAHRLALSEALHLGSAAPWDAILDRAGNLSRRNVETQQQPDTDRPFRDEPTEVLQAALDLASTHAQQAARFRPQDQGAALPAVAGLFQAELQHREGQTPADEAEELVHVGWWCWRGDNHGHLATQACRSDNVPIHVPAEWADEMRAVIQRIEDGDDAPAPVAQQAAAEAEQDDTVHACPGRWGGPNCRCFDAEPAPAEQQAAAADGEETEARRG